MNVCHASRWELEDLEEAIRIQEADLIPRPPSALILVCFQLKQAHKLSRCDNCLRNQSPTVPLTHPLTGAGVRRCYHT